MYTPFEILQLKQKQRKYQLTASQSKNHRTLYIKFDKQIQNIAKKTSKESFLNLSKNKSCLTEKKIDQNHINRCTAMRGQKRYKSQDGKQKDKKYQIICRQSIRKVNTYRAKVYHTHRAFKDQTFMLKLNAFKQKIEGRLENGSNQQINFNNYQIKSKTAKQSVRISKQNHQANSNIDEKHTSRDSDIIKFKIFLDKGITIHSQEIGLQIPEFLVEKCKINTMDQRQKQKIQKAIQKLYERNIILNSQNGQVVHSVKNTSNSNKNTIFINPQNDKRKFSFTASQNLNQNLRQADKNCNRKPISQSKDYRNESISIDQKKDQCLYQTSNSMNQYSNQYPNEYQQFQQNQVRLSQSVINDNDLMNFIKKNKKKRLPVSRNFTRKLKNEGQKRQNESYLQFRRTITQDCKKRQNLKNSIQMNSLRNNSGSPTKIKFNTIEQNISGWEIDHLQAYDPNTPIPSGRSHKK